MTILNTRGANEMSCLSNADFSALFMCPHTGAVYELGELLDEMTEDDFMESDFVKVVKNDSSDDGYDPDYGEFRPA